MQTNVSAASPCHLPAIAGIIAQAQEYLRSQGVSQWQNGYPSVQLLAADIASKNAYVLTAQGQVAAYCVLQFTPEPDYSSIHCGAWGSSAAYATLHRLAVGRAWRGQGLGKVLLLHMLALCAAGGYSYQRADTHPKNLPMHGLLLKAGFVRRGVIYLSAGGAAPGAQRIAYDRIAKACLHKTK